MIAFSYWFQGVFVPLSTLIPIVLCIIKYGHLNKPLKIIFAYLIFAFIINIAGSIMADHRINNLPLLHLYTIGEYLFIACFFLVQFKNKMLRRVIICLMIIFPAVCICNFIFIQNIHSFNTYTRPIEAILILSFCARYLFAKSQLLNLPLLSFAETWVAAGLLFYFSSSLFQFVFSNYVSYHAPLVTRELIWDIHASFVLFMYALFSKGILQNETLRG